MEKQDKLIDITCQELIKEIVTTIREKAKTIPTFAKSRNGCIRLGLQPLCLEAEAWLGGELSDFDPLAPDACIREFSYAIFPGGSRVIEWEDPSDHHIEPVNCHGYSAMKVSGLMWRRQHNLSNPAPAEQLPYITEENGWSQHKGALDALVKIGGQEFVWLYVCVSGATSDEDRRCAYKGLLAARDLLHCHPSGLPSSWIIEMS